MRSRGRTCVQSGMHSKVCRLMSLVYRGLHVSAASPGVGRVDSALLWTWGRSLIAFLSRSRAAHQRSWAAFLVSRGVTFHSYSTYRIFHKHVVYARLSIRNNLSYGGYTCQGIVARESARVRKYRQSGLGHEEPALTVWRQRQCFYDAVPVVLELKRDKRDAEAGESQLLEAKRCNLNTPHVYLVLKRRAPLAHHASVNFRLWTRARRLRGDVPWLSFVPAGWRQKYNDESAMMWHVIHTLADRPISFFSLERRLRSHITSEIEIYLLYRMANNRLDAQ